MQSWVIGILHGNFLQCLVLYVQILAFYTISNVQLKKYMTKIKRRISFEILFNFDI